jgi:hypothetical protein
MTADSLGSQAQRKIELQSPEDLSYLIANVRAAAATRLNEAFPHVDGQAGEDDLRDEIERLVNEVRSTFEDLESSFEKKKKRKKIRQLTHWRSTSTVHSPLPLLTSQSTASPSPPPLYHPPKPTPNQSTNPSTPANAVASPT